MLPRKSCRLGRAGFGEPVEEVKSALSSGVSGVHTDSTLRGSTAHIRPRESLYYRFPCGVALW